MVHLLYLDPGTGSMLLQALIAGFVGAGIFFKNIKTYVTHIFGKGQKNIDADASAQTASPHEGN